MNVKKILLGGVIIIALVAAYVWFFVYNKPHENIEEAKTDYSVTLPEIVSEYVGAFDSSNSKYNGKVIEISGAVDRVEPNDSISSIVFKAGGDYEIFCEVYPRYNKEAKGIKANEKIIVKGFVSGAEQPDEMLEISGIIRLKKCSILNK